MSQNQTLANITKDAAYDAVAPDDFASMIQVERYANRSDAFDKIISATHDHFWDPLDKRYIDFSEPFDIENTPMMPDDFFPALLTPTVQAALTTEKDKVRFINEQLRWALSSILHGEQGALNLSASLCHVLRDPGAQEYAANQTREEARHVTGFSQYIFARWGTPYPAGPVLTDILTEIIHSPEVYKKIVGMQMLVEGLAMGAFATIYSETADPVLRRLMQLTMTDEAFHHKFGKIWADRTVPKLNEEEHAKVEDWAVHCFEKLLFNLVGPQQMAPLYASFGIDPEAVATDLQSIVTDEYRRQEMQDRNNIFRVLAKTLWNAGIITDRTKDFYAIFVNLDEFKAEGEEMVGDAIAEEGMAYLKSINFKDSKFDRAVAAE